MPTMIGQAVNATGSSMRQRNGLILFDDISLATSHPLPLPLCSEHDSANVLGSVVYIESHHQRGVHIVAMLDHPLDADDERRYLSIGADPNPVAVSVFGTANETSGGYLRHEGVVLHEVSLVEKPGAAVTPVTFTPLDIRHDKGGYANSLSTFHRQVLDRCHDHLSRHRRATAIEVQLLDNDSELDRHLADLDKPAPPPRHPAPARYRRQLDEVPPELVSVGRTYKRVNIGHVITVR